jgi:hypothetical protein
MKRPSNRDCEQHYFDQFRHHFPLPSGKVEHGDKPDVVIHGERVLGIEIANLYLTDGADPRSEQVQRKRREVVVRTAQAQHSRLGGKKIELTVSFEPARPITDAKAVASSLAAVAQSIEHLCTGAVPRQHFAQIPHLKSVYYNAIEYPDARWQVSQVYPGVDLSVDRVAQLVAAKERLLAEYKKCDAYWLLLVVDFMDAAQDQEIVWPSEVASLKTTYERVIIYKPQLAQWRDARVER